MYYLLSDNDVLLRFTIFLLLLFLRSRPYGYGLWQAQLAK
jgi:hypothetical protein